MKTSIAQQALTDFWRSASIVTSACAGAAGWSVEIHDAQAASSPSVLLRQRSNGERVIHRLRWGLVPSWSKDEAIATRFAKIGAGKFRPLRPMPSA